MKYRKEKSLHRKEKSCDPTLCWLFWFPSCAGEIMFALSHWGAFRNVALPAVQVALSILPCHSGVYIEQILLLSRCIELILILVAKYIQRSNPMGGVGRSVNPELGPKGRWQLTNSWCPASNFLFNYILPFPPTHSTAEEIAISWPRITAFAESHRRRGLAPGKLAHWTKLESAMLEPPCSPWEHGVLTCTADFICAYSKGGMILCNMRTGEDRHSGDFHQVVWKGEPPHFPRSTYLWNLTVGGFLPSWVPSNHVPYLAHGK